MEAHFTLPGTTEHQSNVSPLLTNSSSVRFSFRSKTHGNFAIAAPSVHCFTKQGHEGEGGFFMATLFRVNVVTLS